MMDREKMMGFMTDMCSKGMSEEDKQKMKDMCKGMAGQFPSCCSKIDISAFMKQCFPESETAKDRT